MKDVRPEGGPLEQRLAALDRLGQDTGEPGMRRQVVEAFLYQGSSDLETMKQALSREDPPAFEAAAHSLSGSSSVLGAMDLTTACRELEALAREGDLAACAARLSGVERSFRTFASRLQQTLRPESTL